MSQEPRCTTTTVGSTQTDKVLGVIGLVAGIAMLAAFVAIVWGNLLD